MRLVPEEIERDVLRESLDSNRDSSFKDMDMLWLCLGAITAYIVGKGAGPDILPSDESPSERAPTDQEDRTEGGSRTGEPDGRKKEETTDKESE